MMMNKIGMSITAGGRGADRGYRVAPPLAVLMVLLISACAGPGTRAPAPVESRTVDPAIPAPTPVTVPSVPSRVEVQSTAVPDAVTVRPQPLSMPSVTTVEILPERSAAQTAPRATTPSLAYLAPPTTTPAVDDLLRDVRRHWADGRHEQAAASLERALRIEPRNPYLWQHLAAVRLDQGRPQLAEQFAAKSNSYSGNNTELRLRNWRIVAAARRAGGDERGAREAEARAAQYRRGGR